MSLPAQVDFKAAIFTIPTHLAHHPDWSEPGTFFSLHFHLSWNKNPDFLYG
jgi:hypothetical protein